MQRPVFNLLTIASTLGPALGAAAQPAATPPQEPETIIEVTSTRLPRPLAQSVAAVTVITAQQIEARRPFDLAEIIAMAPGVAVSRSGSPGQTTTVRLRGAESDHTLVLIDGVRVNSPSSGLFDFGTIPIENIERVEVSRGAQSGLYGSEALGGVINIITKRGAAGPMVSGGSFEYGSHGTNRQVLTGSGQTGSGTLSFSATRLASDGYFQNDDYRNLATSLRYDVPTGKSGTLSFLGRYEDGEVGAPNQRDLSFDRNARSKPRNALGSVQWTREGTHRQDKIVIGLFDRALRYDDPVDAPGGSFNFNRYNDQVAQLEAQTAWTMGAHTLTLGGEHVREKAGIHTRSGGPFGPFDADFAPRRHNTALFAQDEWRAGKLSLVPSVRWEDNSQFGSDLNGRLAAAWRLSQNSKIKASAGTGFRAPSFNELYFPNFGNPNLRPEQNTGFDLGYEFNAKSGARAEVTLFSTRFRNLIGSDPVTFLPANIDRATTRGVEFSLHQPLRRDLSLLLNQTFLDVDSANSNYILRRPKYSTTADLLLRRGKWNGDLGLVSQGRRFDDNFVFGPGARRGDYPGFTRLDLTVGYTMKNGNDLYVRFGNLLNNHYEEVAGYPAPTFNFVIGVRAKAF